MSESKPNTTFESNESQKNNEIFTRIAQEEAKADRELAEIIEKLSNTPTGWWEQRGLNVQKFIEESVAKASGSFGSLIALGCDLESPSLSDLNTQETK